MIYDIKETKRKKLLWLILILTLVISLIYTGCSRERRVNDEAYQTFQDEMLMAYDFLESCDIYFTGGPDLLQVKYDVAKQEDFGIIFEATKAFLLAEGNLELIEANDNLYYPIKEIHISFMGDNKIYKYVAEYYKPGPEGYQDNRYWTEDNADRFETWVYSEVEIEQEISD